MSETADNTRSPRLAALVDCLDAERGRYRELRDAADVAEYLDAPSTGADEEMLTEPVLAALIERVLGFPHDGYFPQRQRAGLKPDFTQEMTEEVVEHAGQRAHQPPPDAG